MDVDLGDLCEGARIVLDRLGEEGDVWIVGGWVRDRIAGKVSEDLDLATNLIPSEVKSAFPKSIMVGEEFGTVLVRVEDSKGRDFQCEVTTLRKDGGYTDGRRPDNVTFGNDIAEDLARRDFTINLRTVGQAEERLGEDGLRMVRAFRFLDLGEGGLREFDPELSAAISSNLSMLSKVSKERIWNEFQRVLSCSNSMRIVESMVEHGIFEEILPGISINTNTKPSDDHIVNLALICRDEVSDGPEMSDRIASLLRLSRKESSELSSLHECRKIDLDPSVESVRRFSATMSDTQKSQILDYMRGLGTDTEDFESELEQNSDLKAGYGPLVDGSRISEITGLEGGKRLGRLKDWLHRIQVERDLSSEEEVVELLAEFDWRNSDFEEWQGLSWP